MQCFKNALLPALTSWKWIVSTLFVTNLLLPDFCSGQQVWQSVPANLDFHDPQNWLRIPPGATDSYWIGRTQNPLDTPILRKDTVIGELRVSNGGQIENSERNSDGKVINAKNLTVLRDVEIEQGSIYFFSDDSGPKVLNCRNIVMDGGLMELRNATLRAHNIQASRYGQIWGTGEIVITDGGTFALNGTRLVAGSIGQEGGILKLSSDKPGGTFAWDGFLHPLHGNSTARGDIQIINGTTLDVDFDMSSNPFAGEIQFLSGGGRLESRFKLEPGIENRVRVSESSHANIEALDLNGGALLIDGSADVGILDVKSGWMRCTGQLEGWILRLQFPDVHSGGQTQIDFERGSRLRVDRFCYLLGIGKTIDVDGVSDDLLIDMAAAADLHIEAQALENGGFAGDIVMRPESHLRLKVPCELAGSIQVIGDERSREWSHLQTDGASLTGTISCEANTTLTIEKYFRAEAGSIVTLGKDADLWLGLGISFHRDSELNLSSGAEINVVSNTTIENGVQFHGEGAIHVFDYDLGSVVKLNFYINQPELEINNEERTDFGYRSGPIELRRYEQTSTGTTRIRCAFTNAPAANLPLLPVMEELVLAGTLELSTDHAPKKGDQITLFHARSIQGQFDRVKYPRLPAGLAWDLERTKRSIILKVVESK